MHSCVLLFMSNLSNVHLFSFQGKFEMSWLNILSIDFILFTLSLLSLLFLWVELFEISFMIARWEPQCFLLYRLLLTTTGINWQRLHIFLQGLKVATPPRPNGLQIPYCLRKDGPMSNQRLLKRVQQGKVRKYSPLSENFHFYHFKAPALLFGFMITRLDNLWHN